MNDWTTREETIESNQNESDLYHYGVKGMKWGVRKDKPRSQATIGQRVKQSATKARKTMTNLFEEELGLDPDEFNAKATNLDKGKYVVNKLLRPDNLALMVVAAVLPGIGYPMLLAGKAAVGKAIREKVTMKHADAELKHYGILGMKWGVRRTPEQLGHHKIKKGKSVYRTAPKGDEESSGSTYVSFLPPERDLYKGQWAWAIRKNNGLHQGERLFETKYKLKEDLNIPSREEQSEVVNLLRQKDAEENIKNIVAAEIKTTGMSKDEYIHSMKGIAGTALPEGTSPKDAERILSKRYDEICEKITKKYIQDYKDMTPDQFFRAATSWFGIDTVSKQKVIDELSKRGYNAMIDQGSVGGVTRDREGVEPLIIFDKEKTLEVMGSKEISAMAEAAATKRYRDWYNVANSAKYRKNPW